jgi:hypothetical protein
MILVGFNKKFYTYEFFSKEGGFGTLIFKLNCSKDLIKNHCFCSTPTEHTRYLKL